MELQGVFKSNFDHRLNRSAFEWGGKFRRLPSDFELGTKWTMKMAFQLWFRGNPAKSWPPLRKAEAVDVSDERSKRKRFSEYRSLMLHCEANLGAAQIENPTENDINSMFEKIAQEGLLPLGVMTPKGKKRRLDQLSWSTFARALSE